MRGRRYQLEEAIKQWPEGDRPREKLVSRGASYLSDSELLAIIIGSGSGSKNALDLARELIKVFDGLEGIEAASIDELCRVRGVGEAKAIGIKAGLELGRRFSISSRQTKSTPFRTSDDVARYYLVEMKNLRKEIFKVALLNSRNRLIKTVTVSEGGLNGAVVHPREVFNPAIRESASRVILIHNHPSGDPEPSDDDINYTRRIVDAGRLMDIKVIDHLIIGDNRHYSFADEGML